jgi:signal transduction histidine kinase
MWRWLNSLGARITFFVILAMVIAQIIGIFVIAKSTERDQGEVRTENFIRQIATATGLFNATPSLDRRGYLRNLNAPGSTIFVSRTPSVPTADAVQPADWPGLPANWNIVASADKRIAWFEDTRPLTMRYTIAPFPTQRNLTARGNGPPNGGPNPPPEGGPQPGAGPDGPGPGSDPGLGGSPSNGGPGSGAGAAPPDGPPLDGRPPPRWRMSVALADGEWLNAEQMYELGLAPWLRTVLYQNSVIFVLMIVFLVPAVLLATRRLTLLARAADKLGRGEDSEPLPESGTTEIRHLTQAFNNMSHRLRRFVQGRTQMLAGISHDLRTPITALRLRTDLVDDDENRERMQALIDDMHHLTEATLTLAKDESFTEKSDKVDISSLIDGICDDLSDAGIDATAEVERGVSLVCRPYSLRRAIRNVAENGVKYGKRSRIHMNGDARNVRIIVDDDGPGIPEDQMERAFQPFVRLEESRSRETGGSGLGLAITRSIVLNHGGDVALMNRSEGGLRVVITLPKGEDG